MAEDMQEVEVSGGTSTARPSAWKTGLAITAMTANPLLGLGAGIATHFKNKSYLDKAAASRNERAQLNDRIDDAMKTATPEEQKLLQFAKGRVADGWERIAGGDASGYPVIEHAQGIVEQLLGKEIDARMQEEQAQHTAQRQLIGDAAKGYKQQFQDTKDAFDGINRSAQQILALTADPTFDPNKPLNKAHLAELLSMGGLMFKDTPDMMDGLTQGVSAVNGMAGGIVGGIATAMKSKDFKVTAEDYNKLALNAQKYARIYAQQKIEQLGSQGAALDKVAKKVGVIPEDYSVADYITGGDKELRMTPNPVPAQQRAPTPTQSLINPPTFSGFGRGGSGPKRPTN